MSVFTFKTTTLAVQWRRSWKEARMVAERQMMGKVEVVRSGKIWIHFRDQANPILLIDQLLDPKPHSFCKIYFYFLPSCVSKVDSNRHVWWEITTAQQGICLCGSQWTWSLTSSLKWQQAGSYKLLWPVTPFTSGALTAEFLGHPHDGLCPLIPWNLYQVNRLHCLFADLEINPGH